MEQRAAASARGEALLGEASSWLRIRHVVGDLQALELLGGLGPAHARRPEKSAQVLQQVLVTEVMRAALEGEPGMLSDEEVGLLLRDNAIECYRLDRFGLKKTD